MIIFYTSIIHYAQLCFNEVIFIFCGVFLDVCVIRRYLPYFTINYRPTRLFCRIPFPCPPPKGFFKQKIPGKGIIHPLPGHSHTQQHLSYSTSVIHHPAIPLRRPYPISQPPPPGIPWTPACPCTPRPGAYSILCASAAAAPFPPVHPRSSGLGLADCGGTYRGKQRPASRP